jgi:hypothetical protein
MSELAFPRSLDTQPAIEQSPVENSKKEEKKNNKVLTLPLAPLKTMQTTMNGSNAAPEKPTSGGNSTGAVFDFFRLLDELLRRRETFFEEIFNGQRVWMRLRWFVVAMTRCRKCLAFLTVPE